MIGDVRYSGLPNLEPLPIASRAGRTCAREARCQAGSCRVMRSSDVS